LRFGQSFTDKELTRDVTITTAGRSLSLKPLFRPYQSFLVKTSWVGLPEFIDISYEPPPAVPYRADALSRLFVFVAAHSTQASLFCRRNHPVFETNETWSISLKPFMKHCSTRN
jgi:hypothetical protein